MNYKLFWIVLVYVLLSASCRDEDTTCENPCYSGETNGFFIANEGPFQRGSGTISFYDYDTKEICNRAYQRANCGDMPGNIVQSLSLIREDAFIVVNNADMVIVADKETLKLKKKIKGVRLPRYMTAFDEHKAFVSYWGNPGGVALINLQDLTVEKRILTGQGAEKMLLKNGLLYVTNSGGFGRDSTVVVIDGATETVLKTIIVGDNPNSIQMDNTGAIWVLCGGYTDWNNPDNGEATNSKLVKIVDGEIAGEFELTTGAKNLVIDNTGRFLYFTMGGVTGNVYRVDTESVEPEALVFFEHQFYSLGFDKGKNLLLGADCKDFNAAGEIFIIDGITGNLKTTVFAGLIPGSFSFRED